MGSRRSTARRRARRRPSSPSSCSGRAGGIIPVPANWARALREFCDERGALLIADEALTGLGRTGRWFAFEHTGVVPDLVVTSKALGGGVPLSAVITSAGLARQELGTGFLQAALLKG